MLFTVEKTISVEIEASSVQEALELFGDKKNWVGEAIPEYKIWFFNEETKELVQEM